MIRKLSKLQIAFAAVFLVLLLFIPRTGKFAYDYEKGKTWKYGNLFAQFDFPVYKTQDQVLSELGNASRRIVPYYRYQEDVPEAILGQCGSLPSPYFRSVVSEILSGIYSKGVVVDESIRLDAGEELSDLIYIQKEKRAVKCPGANVYSLTEARSKLLAGLRHVFPKENVDSVLKESSLYDCLRPNLIYDPQTTEIVNSEVASTVSPTSGSVSAGQLIVSNGELVTAEIAQMLDSYKKEYEATVSYSGPRILLWLGNAILAIAILSVLYFVIYFIKPKVFRDNRIYYILTVFLIFSVLPLSFARFDENALYLIPYTLAALYLHAFFRPRVIVPVYMTTLLPLLLFTDNGVVLYSIFLVSGLVSIFLFNYFGRGWKQFVVALINFAVLAVMFLAFRLTDMVSGNILMTLLRLFVASLLTVAFYPLIYLFEKVFNLVSNSRLAELCDTSNRIIRELEKKAPGTFQHSLQVMNMADAVARVTDANPLLVRAGALYHDIGKMNNPQCFVENESLVVKEEGQKYHCGLSPEQSARDIIRHVSDGYELAQKEGLPSKVTEFILTHHGTSTASFFFNKYLSEGGDPRNESAFRYPGRKPASVEQVILMLCDSLEAASRTLKEYNREACAKLVEDIVSSKMAAGQFDDAEISIMDLGLVKEELKRYIFEMHHERIEYPKRNRNKSKDKS